MQQWSRLANDVLLGCNALMLVDTFPAKIRRFDMFRILSLICCFVCSVASAQETLWGEYASDSRGVQVAPRQNDEFEVVIYEGGLPGAGWNGKEPQRLLDSADTAKSIIEGLKRVERKSPTEGAKPPQGATVLFGGPGDLKNWEAAPGGHEPSVTDDGYLNGGIATKKLYQNFTLHVEFLPPFQPDRLGNYPGNSGIYLQDRYEIQILDDFGQAMRENSCGAIYRMHEPLLNICYPPNRWQTYDIEFRAARYDDAGKKVEEARTTVRQNGVLIHDSVSIPGVTNGNHLPETAEPGPIHLQKHGDPVIFKNVWILPHDEEKLSKRPVVPAFERLAGTAPTSAHGKLLLSELSCAACHQVEQEQGWLYRDAGPDLSKLSVRVNPGWLAGYLADPHVVKPGTRMPDVMSGLDEAEKRQAAAELAAFLLGPARSSQPELPRWFEAMTGKELFNSVGCAACHNPADLDKVLATSVPLGDIRSKYTRDGLIAFLKNPHGVRSSGRMPSLNLKDAEAAAIASFLLLPPGVEMPKSGLVASVYDFSVGNFKSFDQAIAGATVAITRPVDDFSITTFDRRDNYGIRFEGTFEVHEDGKYRFRVGSDDGSRIYIDGKEVAVVDGTHPYQANAGELELKAGEHVARIDFYELGGGEELTVEWAGPSVGKDWQPMANAFLKTSEATEQAELTTLPEYVHNGELEAAGRKRFASLGCANCHSARENVPATSKASALASIQGSRGCLAQEVPAGLPQYDLSPTQIGAIQTALAVTEPVDVVQHTLASHNCIACHVRDGVGGPEPSRNDYFLTTIHEMGEEGRVPPMLDHVGDKLKSDWLRRVLQDGQDVRPYMPTRMPQFKFNDPGKKNAGVKLTDALVAADQKTDSPLPDLDEGMHRTRTAGRQLVDNGGLACVKCHSFGKYKGLGIQAVNLLDMTGRLREDWIHRYILNPASLRPGTRMPSGFPNGVSVVGDLYDGDPGKQIAAIWKYLGEGEKAAVPKGLLPNPIELKPESAPIIYRNFISGLNPRGIAVGYPERVNIAFDAEDLALKLLWQNEFMDASRHWTGRGQGTQGPMGDNTITYQSITAVAPLADLETPWPSSPQGQFMGYQLDEKGRPAFKYASAGIITLDRLEPILIDDFKGLRRTIETASLGAGQTMVRAAASPTIEQDGNAFKLANGMRIIVRKGQPILRTSGNQQEVLIPAVTDANVGVVYDILW